MHYIKYLIKMEQGEYMLDHRKINIMTRLALFEKKERKSIQLAKYYRFDYIRIQMLKTFLSVTIAVLILCVILAVYKAEYFLQTAMADFQRFGFLFFAGYFLILIVSEFVTVLLSLYKFQSSRKRLGKYYSYLKMLRRYYKEKENEE